MYVKALLRVKTDLTVPRTQELRLGVSVCGRRMDIGALQEWVCEWTKQRYSCRRVLWWHSDRPRMPALFVVLHCPEVEARTAIPASVCATLKRV